MAARRDRLPTLGEVIKRQARPPVDLFVFYLWLQREGAEDTLDFWLDVQQHENLCRAYFKDLRKSGRSVKEDWPQYYEYALRRGSIYNHVNGITGKQADAEKLGLGFHDDGHDDEAAAQAMSMSFARQPRTSQDEKVAHPFGPPRQSLGPDDARAMQRTPSPTYDPASHRPHLSPTLKALYPQRPSTPYDDEAGDAPRRRSTSKREPVMPIIRRDAAITKTDLIASAEVIYAKYLLQGAEKEIYLPPALRIHDFPLSADVLPNVSSPEADVETEAMARVPDLYHAQKEYVYRSLEQDAYPRFLRAKAFGNLTPLSALLRLALGLFALWAAFATALAMIFLDQPRQKRLWIILPFSVAICNVLAHQYDLDPLLVFFGLSETTPFSTIKIREPYVKKLLVGRAIWLTFLTIVLTSVLVVIFVFVPGHRL